MACVLQHSERTVKMKLKILTVLAALTLLLAACATPAVTATPGGTPTVAATTAYENRTSVRIAALNGPTGLGLLNLMAKNDQKSTANKYAFSMFSAPTDIVGLLTSGQADIAALPTNLAANLYEKSNKSIQLLALNTLGVLYVLENGSSINSINDLQGKTIATTGQGSTPEYVLQYLLEQNGVEATVEFYADHSELAAKMITGEVALAMLPEPFVTNVLAKNTNVKMALDINELWNQTTGGGSLLSMGALVVRKAFAEEHPAAVKAFLAEYALSVQAASAQGEETALLAEQYGIIPSAAVAKAALPKCNIVCITGVQMREKTQPFLQILFAANPASVGGVLPDEAFYYLP